MQVRVLPEFFVLGELFQKGNRMDSVDYIFGFLIVMTPICIVWLINIYSTIVEAREGRDVSLPRKEK